MAITTWLPLLQETLAREGVFRWQVQGTSMLPTLRPNSVIEIVPLPSQVSLGDLLVFAAGDSLVVHRLVHRSRGRWITQGDGRALPDPPVRREQLLGIATSAYENDHRYWPGRASKALAMLWVCRYHVGRVVRGVRRRVVGFLYG